MKVRIHKGVLECDKGDGKYVPQLCIRQMGMDMETFRAPPQCTTACPLLDAPCSCGKCKKGKGKGKHVISGCEFEILSEIPIKFDDIEHPLPECKRL